MAAPVFSSVRFRGLCAPLAALFFTAGLLAGCGRTQRESAVQAEALKAEVEAANARLSETEKALAARGDQLIATTAELGASKQTLAEMTAALAERDAQWRMAQSDLDSLKKRDAVIFSDIRLAQDQGRSVVALSRYQQFVRDFPTSPFVDQANASIAALSTESEREAQRRAKVFDPRGQERERLRLFNDGLLTPKELAPLLKNRTRAQVVALLGRPNQIFLGGVESGYVDKVTNPTTGQKGMLIITFDAGNVAAVRVDYTGAKFVP